MKRQIQNWFLAEIQVSSCGELTHNIISVDTFLNYKVNVDINLDKKLIKQKY